MTSLPATMPVTPEYLKSPNTNTVLNKSRESSEIIFQDFPAANSSSYKTASRGDKSSQARKDSIMVVDIEVLNSEISSKSPKLVGDTSDQYIDISSIDLTFRNKKMKSTLLK
mmetsp:Transcript_9874/g.14949  ORF Transcript_9874/g.14949 Transcript_9874/m.14949 type:complete len:112 (-) Transcript_9874:2052-2387(-)